MTTARAPLVSVAVPLFESRRFLEVIEANLRGLDYPHLEVIVSDRHGRDDALAALRRAFGHDPRFRFVEASDGLTWIGHYNALLRAARGDYFMWMPHDDSFPPSYVSLLVECLEARPDAVLAFGRIEPVDHDDVPLPLRFAAPRFGRGGAWTLRDSVRLLFWHPAVPFRGVFRRAVATERDLWIPETRDTIGADAYWVFALSLVGRLAFVPSCACRKRYHASSASAAFRPGLRHVVEGTRHLRHAVASHARGRGDAVLATAAVLLWGGWWAATLPLRRLPAETKLRLRALAYGPPAATRGPEAPAARRPG
jgi:GT2 family glycosyltransferase